MDIIANERVCFTPPERFNDLLDVRPQVVPVTNRAFLREREKEAQEAFLESLPPERRPKTKKERKRFIRQFASGGIEYIQAQAVELAKKWEQELQGVISQHFGVLCLSESNDDPLMWAHYAEDHAGLVIEFDTAHESFKELGALAKVEYLAHRPVYDPAVGAVGFWRQKENRWAYEREWRIARELRYCEMIQKDSTTVYLCPIARGSVKAVYLGQRINQATQTLIRDMLCATRAEVFQARLDGGLGRIVFDVIPKEAA